MTNEQKELNTDWTKDSAYTPETPYLQLVPNEFTKFWISKKQEGQDGAFQPIVKIMEDENNQPIYNEYKDNDGNVTARVLVKKATWTVINENGKSKIYSCTVGGSKSLFSKIKSRIIEVDKEGKDSLGLKIKKSGSGITTSYDIETNQESIPEIVK